MRLQDDDDGSVRFEFRVEQYTWEFVKETVQVIGLALFGLACFVAGKLLG